MARAAGTVRIGVESAERIGEGVRSMVLPTSGRSMVTTRSRQPPQMRALALRSGVAHRVAQWYAGRYEAHGIGRREYKLKLPLID